MLAQTSASIIWGTADVARKVVLDAVPPITLAALRFGIAFVILWPLARYGGGACRVPARTTAPLGLLGVALAFLLQNLGLERTTASNASLLQGAAPILTLGLAMVLLGERPGRMRLGGAAIAIVGLMTVILPGGRGLQIPGLGDALVLGSAACFAAFAVLGRRAFLTYGTFPVLAAMMAWGTAALAPASAFELLTLRSASIDVHDAILVLYLGAGCSALTYALWGFALRSIDAGRAVVFDNLVPVVGCLSAVLMLRESPTQWQVVGGALVVIGVWLATWERAAISGQHVAGPLQG